MAKKHKIVIRRDDDLQSIDDELGSAIDRLEDANVRINELLQHLDQTQADPMQAIRSGDWYDESAARAIRNQHPDEEE
ncbi:MAG: hypothetical protein AMXMBFR4_15400 [Candidatus Hydrogenedentota bacterium]